MADDWTTKKVDKFIVVNKKLGSGAYGTVYRGFYGDDESKQVAVKTIPIKVISDTPKMLELIKREISILQKIKHNNIVRLIDVARTNNYLYMFLEYCADGDLKEYMQGKQEKRLSELEAVIFLKHIVEGFKSLYQQKIIHRDIKPANILLSGGVAKITDFGFARVIENEMNDPAVLSRLGSPLYMAPQILEGSPFSAKCDVWSLGIVFYELLYGHTPWTGDNPFNLLEHIKNQPLKFPPKPVRSQKVKQLIQQMLMVNEKDRLSWDGVFNDPTIKIDEERIKKNMEVIMKEKDEISKSISLNRLYIEQNLVVGYLANNPINTMASSDSSTLPTDDSTRRDSTSLNSQNDSDTNGDLILSNYQKEKKKRDTLLKYYNYFLFERNIAFFFNFVIQKVIKLFEGGELTLKADNYFRLIYLIAKNQMIHLERVHKQLNTKEHDKFDKVSWGTFLASTEYSKAFALIKQDMQHCLDFFTEISKKAQEVQKVELEKNPGNVVVTRFFDVLNYTFEGTETFHTVYRDTIQENMREIRNNSKSTKDSLLCFLYFGICLNPYDEFKDINYDFNKFYEDNENLGEKEVLDRVAKLQTK